MHLLNDSCICVQGETDRIQSPTFLYRICVYRRIQPHIALSSLVLRNSALQMSVVSSPLLLCLTSASLLRPEQRHRRQGLNSFQRGDFEQAMLSWTEAARLYEAEQKSAEQSSALIHVAQAYQALGQYRDALKNLELLLTWQKKSGNRTQIAFVLGRLGNVYIATGPRRPRKNS